MQQSMMNRIRGYFGSPVDGGSMAIFRIGFGTLTAWIIYELLQVGADGRNGVDILFTPPETTWTFPYPWLGWLQPYPEPWTTLLFTVCFISACLVAVGLIYRVASVVLCLTFWHIVLMESTLFGNQFPLVGVFTVLMAVIPAHRRYSLDRLISVGLWRKQWPTTVGFWAVFATRFQTFLIYLYGGVTKLHEDWLAGQPIRMWFSDDGMYRVLGDRVSPENIAQLQEWLSTDLFTYAFSYGGLIFDLTIGTLLIIRRTRWLAFAMATFFHTFNFFFVQHVAIVAPIAFWATLMFFEPDWPTRLWHFVRRPRVTKPDWAWLVAGVLLIPGAGALLGWKAKPRSASPSSAKVTLIRWPLLLVGIGWLSLQTLFPLRHFLMPDDAYWTDRGTRFSWFLMTRNKIAGLARMRVEDPLLVRKNDDGRLEFDWEQYQGPKPPVVYFEVDARTVRWSELPEIFVTFEPLIGERIFFNPAAAGLAKSSKIEEHVQRLWQQQYGRPCTLSPTYPLPLMLKTLQRDASNAVRKDKPGAMRYLAVAVKAKERLKDLLSTDLDDDEFHRRYYSFKTSLYQLQEVKLRASELLRILMRTCPFALQGNPAGGPRPILIIDKKLMRPGKHVSLRLQRNQWHGQQTAYADFSIFPWPFMQGLPRALPAYRPDGPPSFIWNYGVELNRHQIKAMELMPLQFHTYVEHVADMWQGEQGHRPKIFGTSYAKLNDRPMQKIIDPNVDLAGTPHSLFGENLWILPAPDRPKNVVKDDDASD